MVWLGLLVIVPVFLVGGAAAAVATLAVQLARLACCIPCRARQGGEGAAESAAASLTLTEPVGTTGGGGGGGGVDFVTLEVQPEEGDPNSDANPSPTALSTLMQGLGTLISPPPGPAVPGPSLRQLMASANLTLTDPNPNLRQLMASAMGSVGASPGEGEEKVRGGLSATGNVGAGPGRAEGVEGGDRARDGQSHESGRGDDGEDRKLGQGQGQGQRQGQGYALIRGPDSAWANGADQSSPRAAR